MKKSDSILDWIEQLKEPFFALLLFLTAFIFRLPTLFNDFYDVDELAAIIQAKEYLTGNIPGIDFTESKLPLYHAIFKLSYIINSVYGWVIVHALTIVIVFLTAYSVYLIGKLVRDRRTGVIASLMYAVLISSFNRHFMAVNGEVIYNLPVTAGLLFFLLALKNRSLGRRLLFFMLTLLLAAAAMMVKVHGTVLLIFVVFFVLFYMQYYSKSLRRMLVPYTILLACVLAVTAFDFFITKRFVPGLLSGAWELMFYATSARSGNPLFLLGIYAYRQLTVGIWHFALWIPAALYLFRFIGNRFRSDSIEESAIALFALLTFLMVFSGGARLYYHYFMTCYPSLCLAAAIAIVSADVAVVKKISGNLITALLIPGLFFFSWNVKDLYIKYFNQNFFYNESDAAFWFRAVVVSSMDDYLLPDGIYRNTVEYIKNNTGPSDKIFVWGDGPHLYYFTDRRIAIKHVWPKGKAIEIEKLYSKKNSKSIKKAEKEQKKFISQIEKRKPELFIDTSPKGLIRGFSKYGNFARFPYEVPPLMKKYLAEHYRLETVIDEYKIYRRLK